MASYDPRVLDEIATNLDDLLKKAMKDGNYELYSGKAAKSYQSPKAFDGIKLQQIPGSGAFRSPEFVKATDTTVKNVADELLKVRIAQALSRVGSLDLPANLPPLPEPIVPTPLPKPTPTPVPVPVPKPALIPKLLSGLGPSLVLDLLLTPLETNKGEDARLKQYKADDLRSSGGPR